MEQTLLNVDGKKIDGCWVNRTASNKNKPVLIFLHEGLGCIELWRKFPQQLCEKTGLSGFVYSRIGYGNSDPCNLPRPITYMHDEAIQILPAVLDQAGIEQAILVGHSDGGSIALIYGGAVGGDKVIAIITLAAHVFSEKECASVFLQAQTNYKDGDLRGKLKKYHGDNVDCAFYGWLDAWIDPEFEFWNLEEFLPSIKVPVLVIQGVDDQYGTVAQVRAIADGIGSLATTHMVNECGHSPHLEQPDETLLQIAGFIDKL